MTGHATTPDGRSLFPFLRRVWLTLAMTLEYGGRFPRRKMLRFYWQQAAKL